MPGWEFLERQLLRVLIGIVATAIGILVVMLVCG